MKQLNLPKIGTFLALCFGMSWGSFWILQQQVSNSPWIVGILALLFIWAPGFAAIITQAFVYGESLEEIGYYRQPLNWKHWVWSRLGPVGILGLVLFFIFIMGNVLHVPSAGKVILGKLTPSGTLPIDLTVEGFFHALLPAHIGLASLTSYFSEGLYFITSGRLQAVGLLVLLAWMMGATLFAFVLRGEELGFRGFLLNELQSKGFLGSNLIIGGIWGVYGIGPVFLSKTPLIPTGDLFMSLLFTLGFCISISFPLAYLRLKSNTIRSSSVFRGILMLFSVLVFLFTWDTDLQFYGINGFIGMVIFLVITYLIMVRDKEFVETYEHSDS